MRKKLFGKDNPMYKHGLTKVGSICIDCGKHLNNFNSTRCNSCARTGKLNSQYKYGNIYCVDCNKLISQGATRCKPCRGKTINGKNNPMFGVHRFGKKSPGWNGGWKLKLGACIDCGQKLKNQNTIRCSFCSPKFKSGKNNPQWKGGKPKCVDCGKQISYGHNRCTSCQGKHVRGNRSPHFGKPAPHGKHIKYKHILFRSTWEANFAQWCDGSNIKWMYEPKMFDLGNTTYTPDFYLPEFDCWIEIKGYWRKDAKQKVSKFIKKYSNVTLNIFQKEQLQELSIIY